VSGEIAIHAVTRGALAVAARLAAALPGAELHVSERIAAAAPPGARPFPLPMKEAVERSFHAHRGHVFVVAIGAVVRMVAPLLRGKGEDPAVVCVDEAGRFAVAVLSGHRGGANTLAVRVAEALGAQPVVTTASDVRGTLAVDLLGAELGWILEDPRGNARRASAAVVNGAPVVVVQEAGPDGWWPEDRPLPANVCVGATCDDPAVAAAEAVLLVTDRALAPDDPILSRAVLYRPRTIWLGVGCDRGAPADLAIRGAEATLAAAGLAAGSVAGIASIDLKADEDALRALARRFRCGLRFFAAPSLDAVHGIERPSARVARLVGTRGVAEPAALLASGADRLLVPKQVYTEPGAGRSLTFAVARVAPGGGARA